MPTQLSEVSLILKQKLARLEKNKLNTFYVKGYRNNVILPYDNSDNSSSSSVSSSSSSSSSTINSIVPDSSGTGSTSSSSSSCKSSSASDDNLHVFKSLGLELSPITLADSADVEYLCKQTRNKINIKTLSLIDCQFNSGGLYVLLHQHKFAYNLLRLNLSNNVLGCVGLSLLADALGGSDSSTLRHLKELNISNNKVIGMYLHQGHIVGTIDTSGLQLLLTSLETNTVLTHLDVSSNYLGGLSSDDCGRFYTNYSTASDEQQLLFAQSIAVEIIRMLCDSLVKNTCIQVININSNGFKDDILTIKQLTQLLNSSSSLISLCGVDYTSYLSSDDVTVPLNMSHKNLQPLVGRLLALEISSYFEHVTVKRYDYSSYSSQLSTLSIDINLSHNITLGDSGVASFFDNVVIKGSNKGLLLGKINLSNVNAGVIAVKALARYVATNTCTMTVINLSNNSDIDSKCVGILSNALATNSSVTTVILQGCSLTAAAGVSIAQMLRINQCITDMDLSYNQLVDIGSTAIAASLTHNTALTSLNLAFNSILAK